MLLVYMTDDHMEVLQLNLIGLGTTQAVITMDFPRISNNVGHVIL